MSSTREMVDATAGGGSFDPGELAAAIEACAAAEQACTACADACLAADEVAALRRCSALTTSCSDVCGLTVRLLSRQAREDRVLIRRVLQACVHACGGCAEECTRHAAHHAHCGLCAKACRASEHACRQLLDDEALAELQALAGG